MNLALPTVQNTKSAGAAGTVLPSANQVADGATSGEAVVAEGLGLAPEAQFSEVLEASASTLLSIGPIAEPTSEVPVLPNAMGEAAPLTDSGSPESGQTMGELLPESGNALPPASAGLDDATDAALKSVHIPVSSPLEAATKQSEAAPPASLAPTTNNTDVLPSAPLDQVTAPLTATPNGAAKSAIAADAQGQPIPVTLPGGALASAVKAIGEPAKPASDKPNRAAVTDMLGGQNPLLASALNSVPTGIDAASPQATALAPVTSLSAPSSAPNTAVSPFGAALDGRGAAALEQSLEQIAQTREASKVTRPEILMRHAEFGLVSMRIDAAAGDMRATLSNRDPGFVPAVQAMLAERGVSATSDTASAGQRGSEGSQGQGAQSGQSQRDFGASGSAAGSGQDGPYREPSEPREQDEHSTAAASFQTELDPAAETGARGLFA